MTVVWRWGFWAAAAALLLLVALLGGGPSNAAPLDPRSTEPSGTRALVLLLQDLGTHVAIEAGVPAGTDQTALLLADDLDAARRLELISWVRDGGVLVVADPSSPLMPAIRTTSIGGLISGDVSLDRGTCDIDVLADVGTIEPGGGAGLEVGPDDGQCFSDDAGAFVVSRSVGSGAIVAVGSAGVFVNDRLGRADNSVLAAALLAPRASGRLAFLEAPVAGLGTTTLGDLIAPRFHLFAAQLAVAFGVYALWRARRLGRPVAEPQPVPIAGSELVSAVGGLYQQRRSPADAAALLRADFRRTIGERLGVPASAPVEVLADVAARAGADRGALVAAMSDPVGSDEALLTLARRLDSIRQEVLHGQPTPR